MNNNLQSCSFVILFQIIGLTSSQFGAIVSSKKVWLWNVWLDMPQFKVHFWKRTIVVNSKIICDEKKSYMFSVIVCVQVFMNCIFYINQLWLLVIFFFLSHMHDFCHFDFPTCDAPSTLHFFNFKISFYG